MYSRRSSSRGRRNPEEWNGTAKEYPNGAPRKRKVTVPGFTPKNPKEAKAVRLAAKVYQDHHWGAPATKVIRVKDSLVPDVTAMGTMMGLSGDFGEIPFPEGCWLAWDHKKKLTPLYIVSSAAFREECRRLVKKVPAERTRYLQEIAREAGGRQAGFRRPKVKALALGPVSEITYHSLKKGDDDENGGSGYVHEFGGEDLGGHLPWLAIDVSGRCWLLGGDVLVREAGLVG